MMAAKRSVLEAALAERPQDPQLRRELGRILMVTGAYQEAAKQLKQAVFIAPRLLPDILIDVEQLFHHKQIPPAAALTLADIYFAVGEVDAATIELEEALDQDNLNIAIFHTLGELYLKQERFDDVIQLVEQAIDVGLKDTFLSETLANAYCERGRYQEAIQLYQDLLARSKGDKKLLRILGDLAERAKESELAATSYFQLLSDDVEMIGEVENHLTRLLATFPQHKTILRMLVEVYVKGLKPDRAVESVRAIVGEGAGGAAEGIERLRMILKTYPDHPGALWELGNYLLVQALYSDAVETFHRLSEGPARDVKKAIIGYERVLARFPEQAMAWELVGEAYLQLEAPEKACQAFCSLLSVDPAATESVLRKITPLFREENVPFPFVHFLLGKIYFLKQQDKKAKEQLAAYITQVPHDATGLELMGDVLRRLGDLEGAMQWYEQASTHLIHDDRLYEKWRSVAHDTFYSKISLLEHKLSEDPYRGSLREELAHTYYLLGDLDKAIHEFQTISLDPHRVAVVRNGLGHCFKERGDFRLAWDQFSQSAALERPDQLAERKEGIYHQGLMEEFQGLVHEAIATYRVLKGIDENFKDVKLREQYLEETVPTSIRHKMLLAVLRYRDQMASRDSSFLSIWGRDGRLEASRRRSQDVRVSFGEEANREGFAHTMRGMLPHAEEAFLLAVQLDRSYFQAGNNLALFHLRAGRYDEASTLFQEALEHDPNNPILHANLALWHFMLKDLTAAIEAWQLALRLDPTLTVLYLNLGDALWEQGEKREAIRCWQQACQTFPVPEWGGRRLAYRAPQAG